MFLLTIILVVNIFFKCLPRLFAFCFSLCVLGVAQGAACLLPVRPSTPSPVCSILSVKMRFCTEPATCSSLSMRRIEHKYKLFYLSNSFLLFCVIIFFPTSKKHFNFTHSMHTCGCLDRLISRSLYLSIDL